MSANALVILPGLGSSMSEWADAARALGLALPASSELPPSGSAVVVGHSLGGVQGLRIAAAHPKRVCGLVLTGSFFPPARDGRTIGAALTDYGHHRALYLRDVARRDRAPRPTVSGLRELGSLARLGIRPHTFHALANEVGCPVLVIHGHDDHVVPVAFARAATTRYVAWTYREVADAGHFVHRDLPEARALGERMRTQTRAAAVRTTQCREAPPSVFG